MINEAIKELRQALLCLRLEVDSSIVDDIKRKAERVISYVELNTKPCQEKCTSE